MRPSLTACLRAAFLARRMAFAVAPFGGLLISAAGFHFPEDALALHLHFQNSQRLIDIVVAYENLQILSDHMQPSYWF